MILPGTNIPPVKIPIDSTFFCVLRLFFVSFEDKDNLADLALDVTLSQAVINRTEDSAHSLIMPDTEVFGKVSGPLL